jgi:hypothetical protein
MTNKNLAWLAFPIALALACGGGDGDRKNSLVGKNDSGTGGTSGAAGAAGAAGTAGTAGTSGAAGGSTTDGGTSDGGETDSGETNDAGDGAVALPDTLCPAKFKQKNEAALSVSTTADERFGSITDDELSIAFSIPDGDDGRVFVADRATTSDTFAAPVEITGDFALDRATLGPDGMSLLVVNANKQGFTLLERAATNLPFEAVSPWQYDDIVDDLAEDESLGDPVFALGGQVLLYSHYGAGRTHTVIFASRLSTGSSFVVGGELSNTELLAQGDLRRRPTGISADYRTLFFYDEVSETTKAGFFYGSFDFTSVSDLGDARDLQPSADCNRLYFDAIGTSSADVFIADAN